MKDNTVPTDLREEHLDTLIRLAFRWIDEREERDILAKNNASENRESTPLSKSAWLRFLDKYAAWEKADSRRKRRERARKWRPKILETAACLVLALAIAAPFAIANVDTIRITVMKMLVQIGDGHVGIDLVESPGAAFDIPADWEGGYFPAYIPAGYHMAERSRFGPCVTYRNNDNLYIQFDENTTGSSSSMDSEGGIITYEDVNGCQALIIELDYGTNMAWSLGDVYFTLCTCLSKQEALLIARSVQPVY